jgi:hypothetical protein
VALQLAVGQVDRPDRKVYAPTAAGQQRVREWLADVSWAKPTEFHLKLVAAAAAGLADPVEIVDAQRRELLRRPADAQRAALAEPDGSAAAMPTVRASLRAMYEPGGVRAGRRPRTHSASPPWRGPSARRRARSRRAFRRHS